MDGNSSRWSQAEVSAVVRCLSIERFETYSRQSPSQPSALELYAWNTALSAALYGPLQCLEVALRNSIYGTLEVHYGSMWFENDGLMRGAELHLVRETVDKIGRQGRTLSPGRVVAELPLGFWVGLLANGYDETLWRQHLYRLFGTRPNSKALHGDLDKLRTLRNRIAHHEPIFQRRLLEDYERIKRVLGVLSPELLSWTTFHDRVADVLAEGPHGDLRF